jgi:hypothetical protein
MTATSLSVAYADFGDKSSQPPKDMFAAVRNGQVPNQYSSAQQQQAQQQMAVQPSYAKQVQQAQQQLAFQMANQSQQARQLQESQMQSQAAQAQVAQIQAQMEAQQKHQQMMQYAQMKSSQAARMAPPLATPAESMYTSNAQNPMVPSEAPWSMSTFNETAVAIANGTAAATTKAVNDTMEKHLRLKYILLFVVAGLGILCIIMFRKVKTCSEQLQMLTDKLKELGQTFAGSGHVVQRIADQLPLRPFP